MNDSQARGLALVCGNDGVLRYWLRDDFSLGERASDTPAFIRLLDESSHAKGLEFLARLEEGATLVNWELCFLIAGEPHALNVAGYRHDLEALIVAAASASALRALCRELAVGRPEYSTQCLEVLAQFDQASSSPYDADIYEDFMRMYNDFARLQRESASQSAKLQRLDAEKDRLLDMAAHDLRNPLHIITLLASGLARQCAEKLTPEELALLDKIVQTARNMGRLLNNLLEVSRATPQPSRLQLQPADLAELIQERVDSIAPLAGAKNIQIDFHHSLESATACCDLVRVQQVMDNLLGNALKFSPRDSRVEVVLTATEAGLLVKVCDQGPGIAEDELEQVFQPFTRGSTQPTGGEASSGLGLAICRGIIQAHKGRIWAEKGETGGAAIQFLLPLTRADQQ